MLFNDHDTLKHILDALAAGTALGAVFHIMPEIAALLSIIWYGLRIWESKTVQRWVGGKGEDDGGD